MIYSRESKNDKNFIWYDTTAVIVLIGLCFCLSSIIIICINYHIWLQHLWSVSSLICDYQSLYSNNLLSKLKIQPESNTKYIFLKASRTDEKNKKLCYFWASYLSQLWSVQNSIHKRIHRTLKQHSKPFHAKLTSPCQIWSAPVPSLQNELKKKKFQNHNEKVKQNFCQ